MDIGQEPGHAHEKDIERCRFSEQGQGQGQVFGWAKIPGKIRLLGLLTSKSRQPDESN